MQSRMVSMSGLRRCEGGGNFTPQLSTSFATLASLLQRKLRFSVVVKVPIPFKQKGNLLGTLSVGWFDKRMSVAMCSHACIHQRKKEEVDISYRYFIFCLSHLLHFMMVAIMYPC